MHNRAKLATTAEREAGRRPGRAAVVTEMAVAGWGEGERERERERERESTTSSRGYLLPTAAALSLHTTPGTLAVPSLRAMLPPTHLPTSPAESAPPSW
jgi:hypothetical protein